MGQDLTAVEGNASVYQMNPVSQITGEGRAEFVSTWGPDFDQKGGARGGEGGIVFILSTHVSTNTTRGSSSGVAV